MTYERVPYPGWAVFVAVMLILASVLFIPGVAIVRYFNLVEYKKSEPVSLSDIERNTLATANKEAKV